MGLWPALGLALRLRTSIFSNDQLEGDSTDASPLFSREYLSFDNNCAFSSNVLQSRVCNLPETFPGAPCVTTAHEVN